VAIPVFPSRFFRHSCIYVHAGAGIARPEDLAGRTVGTPEYQMTAPVWIRGILSDEHGVAVESVTYATGGLEEPGRPEKLTLELPAGIRVNRIPPDRTLSAMLAAGEIDAVYSPRIPSSFVRGDGRVARLFPDTVAAEKAYYASTGIFPIMHVVVLRREVYQRHRWVAQSLTKALTEAKQQAYARIYDASALRFMEPWLNQHLEDARQLLGEDYWSYGLGEADRNVLATFLRYHHEQGLSRTLRTPEQLFAPEALEAFVI
jgi:4,5-dihydroxyphthalate decarboxylase